MSNYFKNDDLSFVPFTREQENALFARASSGDREARDQIIKNYLQFAASEGLSEARGQFPEDEVLSAANWGLMTAIQRYDYRKGNGFACFARRFIRGRVGHLRRIKIRQATREVRTGDNRNYRREYDGADAVIGRRASSLYEQNGESFVDHTVEEQDWKNFWMEHVRKTLSTLPRNEQIAVNVIIFEEGDFKILGARLGITPHNARRTYKRAIEALQKSARRTKT